MDIDTYRHSASRITVVAHLFGLIALILLLVWLLHYQGGLGYDSHDPYRVFNVHPFLMFFALILTAGEAMMAYKTVAAAHNFRKFVHMILNLLAICLGIVGICAVFKYHDMLKKEDVYSLHSWIGIATICLFCLQWVLGFITFMYPKASAVTRARIHPWHVSVGRALLYMAICAALTGLTERATSMDLKNKLNNRESRLINFIGLSILIFGIHVDLSVALAAYNYGL